MANVSRTTYAVSVVFIAIAVFFATDHLLESPPLWLDEGIYTQDALNVATHGTSAVQIAPGHFESIWSSNGGFPFIYPIALSYAMFGPSITAGRGVMVVFILAFVFAAFALAYRTFGPGEALGALALIATFPPLYGNGKTVIGEVPGLLYLALFLLTVAYLEHKRFNASRRSFFLAGILAGLCAATKPIFLVLGPAILVALWWHRHTTPWRVDSLLVAAFGSTIPLALHAYLHLAGTPLTTIIGYYANPYGIASTSIMSTVLENALRFITESTPAYMALLILIWSGSIIWRWYRGGSISLAERIAFIYSLLILAAYLRTAGWYRYFFTAHVLGLVFLPGALRSFGLQRTAVVMVTALVLMQSYQLVFTSFVAQYRESQRSAIAHKQISALRATSTLFFVNVPELAIFAENRPYYQYLKETDTIVHGTENLSLIEAGVPDVVVMRGGDLAQYAPLLGHYATTSEAGFVFFARE